MNPRKGSPSKHTGRRRNLIDVGKSSRIRLFVKRDPGKRKGQGGKNERLKGSRKNNFPCLGIDPSRLAALLVLSI